MPRLLILWSAPRSLSSAVYTSMTNLKSTNIKCFHELFVYPSTFGGPDDKAPNFQKGTPITPDYMPIEPSYTAVIQTLFQQYPGVDIVFTKEHAKLLPPRGSPKYKQTLHDLKDAQHTFLIRDPAKVVYSRHKMILKKPAGFEKFDEFDTGLLELYDLYDYITKDLGKKAVVIEAADLQNNPGEMMKLYCEAVNIPFESHMITWEKGKFDEKMPVKDWEKFFGTLYTSTGFIQTPYSKQLSVPLSELSPELVDHIDRCRPHYNKLLTERIGPNTS